MNKKIPIETSREYGSESLDRPGLLSKLQSQYDPNQLLNTIAQHFALKNDAALARMLDISSLVINKIRQLSQPVSGTLLILMHEKTGFSFSELRMFMGDRRQKIRVRDARLTPALVGV